MPKSKSPICSNAIEPIEANLGPRQIDVEIISKKLGRVAMELVALHEMSDIDMSGEESTWFSLTVQSVMKSAVRTIDACVDEMGGLPTCKFRDDLDFSFSREEGEANHG